MNPPCQPPLSESLFAPWAGLGFMAPGFLAAAEGRALRYTSLPLLKGRLTT